MTLTLRLIGDVHGRVDEYVRLAREAEFSLQVGDVGFARSYAKLAASDLDPVHHRFVRGDHDDPTRLPPHALPGWGAMMANGVRVFYVGGAWSPDWRSRASGVDWWPEEEIGEGDLRLAIEAWAGASRDDVVMVTHDCPDSVKEEFLPPPGDRMFDTVQTRTGLALQRMLEARAPKLWVFGHYHVSKTVQRGRTTFKCLDELEVFDLTTEILR